MRLKGTTLFLLLSVVSTAIVMCFCLIEQDYLGFIRVLPLFCFPLIGILDETEILKNDLHKAIMIMALSPFVVYPSVEWPRSIALCGVILLASSYFLRRFFKSRARVLNNLARCAGEAS